ncbi:MAG: hypothetical protein HZB23_11995 [Deltaproteobacteria bacterium]|nr:hypothetical protein [Deltaproteobacteria bacterium]
MKKLQAGRTQKSKKTLFLAIGAVLVFAAAVALFFWLTRDADQDYVFEKNYGVSFSDAVKGREMMAQAQPGDTTLAASNPLAGVNLHQFFTEDFAANPFTLKFFRYITQLFGDSKDRADALRRAREYIFSQLPANEAEKVYALYVKYLDCEIALMSEQRGWGDPKSTEEVLAYLRKAQEFRRQQLGVETADALFGPEVKIQEYKVRRGAIVADKELNGKDKEEALGRLTSDMWGDEAQAVEEYANPYNRYREKLEIYQKDLAELPTEAERAALDREFRQQFFDAEQVKALDAVDAQLAAEKKAEASFQAARSQVEKDPSLTAEEKEQKIKDMGTRMLGQESAEALSRREAMEKGKAELMKKHGK